MSGILLGDAAEELPEVPDLSVDVLFTDPPYGGSQWEAPYRLLAEHADRVLKPGGYLVTYAGQYYLPAVMRALEGAGLEWFWMLCQEQRSLAVPAWRRNVLSLWKPILIWQKPPAAPAASQLLDMVGAKWTKRKHPWEQSLAVSLAILERLLPEGGLVLDPFAGTGTNLLAAKLLSCEWLGFEIEPATWALARQKLEQQALPGRVVGAVSL